MKTEKELNALSEEIKILNSKLKDLTEDDLKQVMGGISIGHLPKVDDNEKYVMNFDINEEKNIYNYHIYTETDPMNFEPKFGK